MNKKDIEDHHKMVENYSKSLNKLPKLKQDIVKSIFQINAKRKYGDLVENIIERKLNDKKNKT